MRRSKGHPDHRYPSSSPPDLKPDFAAHFLVGPTAVGKSAVAQHIAEQEGWDILSADSMLVYRGMDVGTAKPSREDRKRVRHWGLDVVGPDESFSAGQYVEYARDVFRRCAEEQKALIVVGGTGLYMKCLTEGLAKGPPADPERRNRAEALLRQGGVEALQKALRELDPERYEALGADAANPRRVIRAMELAAGSLPVSRSWPGHPAVPLAGLRMDPPALEARIERRVAEMYKSGLLDEVKKLKASCPRLSKTALQAIGYAEALSVLSGDCSEQQAMKRTAIRTRQLAKRQMTWFRHQARVEWIAAERDSSAVDLGESVLACWRKYGPTPVVI
ncbi:MAG: tRNA (adenosine(37)-N6)-dimethylallyltransferase MiaA [Verrucomicrobiota bacterium]